MRIQHSLDPLQRRLLQGRLHGDDELLCIAQDTPSLVAACSCPAGFLETSQLVMMLLLVPAHAQIHTELTMWDGA